MSLLKTIKSFFTPKSRIQSEADILFPALVPEKQFLLFSQESRMRAVMLTGDSGDMKHYSFMKWCILNDPDQGVRLSALKRLTNFSGQQDLADFLMQLDKRTDRVKFEPYLSFNLAKAGVITQVELQARLNGD